MKHSLDHYYGTDESVFIQEQDNRTFTITTVNGKQSFIDGKNIDEIFGKIDGLRIQGKRWLRTYDFFLTTQVHEIYVNIDHIVSIE